MAILNNNPLVGASGNQGGYNINNSLRFRRSASAYLSRTPASAGNQKTWTYSAWVKRGLLGSIQDIWHANGSGTSENDYFAFDSDTLQFRIKNSNSVVCELITTQLFRDPSAWYHIVAVWDSTQATAANRVKLYVNGNQITAFSTATYPSQNTETSSYNNTVLHTIGTQWYNSTLSNYLDGYMTDINFIDGSAKTPSDFGETDTITGVWKPKAYTGTYGTNGFYLKFSDIATTSGSNAGLGKDFSGNSNYWTTNNISVTSGTTYDAMTDSPTLTSATVANYCVLNPLIPVTTTTIINGNLGLSGYNASGSVFGTVGVSSGKWYFEYIAYADAMGGISGTPNGGAFPGEPANAYTWDSNNATKISNSSGASYGSATSNGDIVGVAFDLDSGSITFYKNNVSQGVAYTFTPSGTYFPVFRNGSATNTSVNFGQRPFSYTPPTGYVALNTYNLPDSTIKKGNSYMDATLYTGTGSSLNVTGVNFQPDFVWIKERVGAADHGLYDAVRGVQKQLESNTTTAETTETTGLTAFNSDGFTVGALAQLNTNTDTYVGWSWKANGAGSSNTSGSITSTVSVNTTAGFSIATFTGTGANATIGHGLGVAPKMFIVKTRSGAADWVVYHASVGNTAGLYLNQTAASTTSSAFFNNTSPTSSVFTLGNGVVGNGVTAVAYCFAEIAGFSAFGSYTGNGSTDGTFVYTGFRPKYILIKRTNLTEDWYIYDTSRITYNLGNIFIYADLADAEGTGATGIDILSNGFKQRQTGGGNNASGSTYIYMAFAENPTKYALAR